MITSPLLLERFAVLKRWKTFFSGTSLRSYLWGIGVCLVFGGGIYYFFFTESSTTTTTVQSMTTVERGSIVSSVKATGSVTFVNEQQMRFNQRGTVAKVNIQEGDIVKKGQIIAELDKTSILSDIRQAELAIAASSLQLEQLRNDNEKTVLDAKNDLATSQQKLPSDIDAAARSVSEKQTALEASKLDLEKQRTTELQNLGNTVQSVLTSSEKLLDSFYGVLTRDTSARPSQGNYDLEIDPLLFNDYAIKQSVETAYLNAVNAAMTMREQFGDTIAIQRNSAILMQALSDAQELASNIYTLSENTYDLLRGATTGTTDFMVSDLTTLRTTVSSNRSTAADLINEAETAQANLAAASEDGGIPSVTLKTKQDAVITAENALKTAEENLKVLQTQNPGTLASKQQAFDNTTTGTDIQIRLKLNDIGQKSAALSKTRKTLEDYQLKAPFDGIIRRVDFQVGDNLLADTTESKYIVIENPAFLIITVPLDQVDVVRVRKGMSGSIALDALPGKTFVGTVDEINPTAIEQSGVVSYDVEVKLPTPEGLTILSAMTATVQIVTDRRENVLIVPNLALKHEENATTVQKASGETVEVLTGVTDGRFTEILSGLSEGDSILSVNVATGQSSSATTQQIMRGLGGLGGDTGGPPR